MTPAERKWIEARKAMLATARYPGHSQACICELCVATMNDQRNVVRLVEAVMAHQHAPIITAALEDVMYAALAALVGEEEK